VVTGVLPVNPMTGTVFPVQVQFRDQFGNIETGVNGPVTLSLQSGPVGSVLSGTVTVNAVNGVADFNNLSVNRAGKYTFQAALQGLSASPVGELTATANRLVPAFATTVVAGRKFRFTATAKDAAGKVVASLIGGVTLELVSGPSGAFLSGATVRPMSKGVAIFTPVVSRSGHYLLRLSMGDLVTLIKFDTVPPSGRRVPKPGAKGSPTFTYQSSGLTPAEQFQLHDLQQQYGFHTASPAPANLGLGEKWFQDSADNWFTITSDGRIRAWSSGSGLAATDLTIVASAVWGDLTLLFNA